MSNFLFLPNLLPTRPTPFHIEHGTRPDVVYAFLREGNNAPKTLGITPASWSKITPFLKQLGLMQTDEDLSEFGLRLSRLCRDKHDIAEAITLWLRATEFVSPLYRFSFSFNRVWDFLRLHARSEWNTENNASLVAQIQTECAKQYGLDRVAFSENSLRGAARWLNTTDGPLLTYLSNKTMRFQARATCRPIAVLLALDFLLSEQADKEIVVKEITSERLITLLGLTSAGALQNALLLCTQSYPHYVVARGNHLRLNPIVTG